MIPSSQLGHSEFISETGPEICRPQQSRKWQVPLYSIWRGNDVTAISKERRGGGGLSEGEERISAILCHERSLRKPSLRWASLWEEGGRGVHLN
jgi:hypothetical protein